MKATRTLGMNLLQLSPCSRNRLVNCSGRCEKQGLALVLAPVRARTGPQAAAALEARLWLRSVPRLSVSAVVAGMIGRLAGLVGKDGHRRL